MHGLEPLSDRAILRHRPRRGEKVISDIDHGKATKGMSTSIPADRQARLDTLTEIEGNPAAGRGHRGTDLPPRGPARGARAHERRTAALSDRPRRGTRRCRDIERPRRIALSDRLSQRGTHDLRKGGDVVIPTSRSAMRTSAICCVKRATRRAPVDTMRWRCASPPDFRKRTKGWETCWPHAATQRRPNTTGCWVIGTGW